MGSGTVSFGAGIQVSTAGTVSVYYNPSSNPATGTPSVNSTSYKTATDYSGNITGGGSLTGYMLVNNVYDLQNVNNNLGGAYALGRDIDASVTSTWNSGAGFLPIGNLTLNTSNYNISGSYFGGIFDGQNQAISNLTINRYSTNIVGLFSGNTGQIGISASPAARSPAAFMWAVLSPSIMETSSIPSQAQRCPAIGRPAVWPASTEEDRSDRLTPPEA